jgi:hypothetical protein
MEPCQYIANDLTGFVISAIARKIGKGTTIFGALHKYRIFSMRQYARRALPVPPAHQEAAKSLLISDGYLEHGGRATRSHR